MPKSPNIPSDGNNSAGEAMVHETVVPPPAVDISHIRQDFDWAETPVSGGAIYPEVVAVPIDGLALARAKEWHAAELTLRELGGTIVNIIEPVK